jgi:hypothetical protein
MIKQLSRAIDLTKEIELNSKIELGCNKDIKYSAVTLDQSRILALLRRTDNMKDNFMVALNKADFK